eukprot:Protomagalhaensia_wolfi_Nauph_80__375@NODE_1207_length_1658_cov_222_486720_g927_i0_p1_GENE_NODE_1207_length_1658_cov_222_486720_g927_i0NODE_1207_length_1658_cov_222_486720_g927_i0_p1_ORF_typecomplete_len440_score93_56DMT_YdcZ/PF04657_13/2_3e09DMT_YdcZ/PF04657_13/3_9e20Peptidase_M73/PF12389_8/0_098Peptidase_M73/PF12389_8/8_1e02_NODE_1207_length_1658_cov_222_486720_g927_i0741393
MQQSLYKNVEVAKCQDSPQVDPPPQAAAEDNDLSSVETSVVEPFWRHSGLPSTTTSRPVSGYDTDLDQARAVIDNGGSSPASSSPFNKAVAKKYLGFAVDLSFWRHASMYLFPFSVGLVMPIMGGMNNILQEEVGGNVFCAISLLYGLAFIIVGIWTWFTTKQTIASNYFSVGDFVFQKPWTRIWCLSNGFTGVSQYICFSTAAAWGGLGVFTLGNLIGSVATSIMLDMTGWCWAQKSGAGIFSFVGAAVVGTGAILHSIEVFTDTTESAARRILPIILSIVAGFLLCFQSCVTNKLGKICGELRRSAVWNYFSGAIVLLFLSPYTRPTGTFKTIVHPSNWWKLTQVCIAIYGMVVTVIFQFKLNAAVVYCWLIAGQLLSSTVIDANGWVGLDQRPLTVWNYVGLVVVMLGVGALTYDKVSRSHKDQHSTQQLVHKEEP